MSKTMPQQMDKGKQTHIKGGSERESNPSGSSSLAHAKRNRSVGECQREKKKNKVPIQVQKQVGAKNCHFPGNISQDELEERKAMLISRTVV